MPSILITARPQDQAVADVLQAQLETYHDNVRQVPDNPEAAARTVQAADALLIVLTADWQPDYTVVNQAIESGLRRGDLLTIVVCIDDAPLPPLAALPDALYGLAYTTTARFRTDSAAHTALDIRNLAQQIEGYAGQVAPQSGRRTPWNLILIGTILAIAFVLLIAQQLRRETGDIGQDELPSAVSVMIAPDESVIIGLAAGLSDRAAARGQEMLNGVQLALADRPAVQLGDSRFAIDLLAQDTGCSSVGGQRVAERFTADPDVVGVVGHLCETSCRSTTDIYDNADYATISPACRAPGLTIDLSDSFNRTVPSQVYVAETSAEFVLNDLGIRAVVVIRDEQVFSGQLAERFAREFDARGGTISDSYQIESLTFTEESFVDTLLEDPPAALYYAGRALNAVKITSVLAERGVDIPLILADGTSADDYLDQLEDEADSVGANTYTLREMPPQTDAFTNLAQRYAETYGSEPESALFAYAYDAAVMLLDSIEDTGTVNEQGALVIDRMTLMGNVRSYFGDGVTGLIACDGRGNCGAAQTAAFVLQDGGWVPFVP